MTGERLGYFLGGRGLETSEGCAALRPTEKPSLLPSTGLALRNNTTHSDRGLTLTKDQHAGHLPNSSFRSMTDSVNQVFLPLYNSHTMLKTYDASKKTVIKLKVATGLIYDHVNSQDRDNFKQHLCSSRILRNPEESLMCIQFHVHQPCLPIGITNPKCVTVNLLFIQCHRQKLIDGYKLIECVCTVICSFISLFQFSFVSVPYGTVALLLGAAILHKKSPSNNRKLIV